MELCKKEIQETQISKTYTIGNLNFTPLVVYRNNKFHRFISRMEMGHKVKYNLELSEEDEQIFNALKDFFKSID